MRLTRFYVLPPAVWELVRWPGHFGSTWRPRALRLWLADAYQISPDGESQPIDDWPSALACNGVLLEALPEFDEIKEILGKLVPQEAGLYVYQGFIHIQGPKSLDEALARTPNGVRLRGSSDSQHTSWGGYAACCSDTLETLNGFGAWDCQPGAFRVAWFPLGDPVGDVIRERWRHWPDAEYEPFLPHGPSPCSQALEILTVDEYACALALFGPAQGAGGPDNNELYRLAEPGDVFAAIRPADFRRWRDGRFDFERLLPAGAPLPFTRA